MNQYEWKRGYRAKGVTAQQAGDQLEKIRKKHGAITPELVVTAARPETAPLHPAFEWDDEVAAEGYRRVQAQSLIRHIVIPVENTESQPVRAFVSIRDEDDQSVYTSTAAALSDKALRQQVLDRALRELELWQQRYHDLHELAEVFAAVSSARDQLIAA